jgi:putative transposase
MRRAFKYRLYPNRNQAREMNIMLETHRRLYNTCLEQRRNAWTSEQRSVSYPEQSSWFKTERATNPYFERLNFSSAQATMRRLDKAFRNFFRRIKAKAEKPGYPRFKARGRFNSIEFPAYGDGIRLTDNRLRVQHAGVLKVKLHRPVQGKVKTATLKLEGAKWYVVLSCHLGDVDTVASSAPPVGIDLGLEAFFTTSEGEREPNPRYLKTELPALRRIGRAVSRKKKGGSNRRKAVRRLRAFHARVANLRRGHHHQTSLKLVRRHGLIAVEGRNVKGMLGSRRLARSISDAGWSAFVSTLKHKAESAGVEVVEVDPKGTSQQCSGCGVKVPKDLWVRTHCCVQCGLVLHRDENAAKNILARALQARTGPVGLNAEVA